MPTREDLVLISTESDRDGHQRDLVQIDGKYFVVGSQYCPVDMDDENALADWINAMNPRDMFLVAIGVLKLNETWVMPVVWDAIEQDYVPANICGPECQTGVCNKRVATNDEIGSQELAYELLLGYLNA